MCKVYKNQLLKSRYYLLFIKEVDFVGYLLYKLKSQVLYYHKGIALVKALVMSY